MVSGFFLLLQSICYAQSISELNKKKQEAEKQIEYTTRLLNETQKNESYSLGRLHLINSKINSRNALISNITKEIDIYEDFIADNNLAIKMLENDITRLKGEYAEIIRQAYKHKFDGEALLFILSADNFNQAYHRLLYFRRYTDYRQQQVKTIEELELVLTRNLEKLEQRKRVKEELIGKTEGEKKELSKEKGQQNSTLKSLQNKKRKLQRTLKEQQKVERQLEREIQRIIEEEAKRNRAAGKPGFALTPEQKLIGNNFEQNKSRLPWPVERGVIVERFGIHQHPVLSNVQVENNGINIATEAGSEVRAVFNGEVSRVFGISGGNTAVIIRHGKYLSVYSNLGEVVVKKGDKVSTKQNIGTVYTDNDDGGKSILKFQIWKESNKLNPEHWIGR